MLQKLTEIFDKERQNFYLWLPLIFGLGAAFFISFSSGFLAKIFIFATLFFCSLILFYLNRFSLRSLIYIAIATFFAGAFYSIFYTKTFLNHTEISGKVYVDGSAKIESIKNFHNPINHLDGMYLLVSQPYLEQSKFVKKVAKKEIKAKKPKKKKLLKPRKPRKPADPNKPKKPKKPRKISTKNFVNLKDYQDFDRAAIDWRQSYQNVNWIEKNDKKIFPRPPEKIALILVKANHNLEINDKIAFKAMLKPFAEAEFADDFDYKLNFKAQKIGASGYAIGEVRLLEKNEISNFKSYFLNLREKIRGRFNQHLSGNASAIANALFIGDQKVIDKDFYEKIRVSGLAHLLSISGFHLSLAGAIFFFSVRFLLARSEYLTLRYDIKKIAAFLALIASYVYLQIADSPVPAKRAFLMIFCIFIALMLQQKINSKRVIAASMLAIIFYNPYIIFNIGFQLSFLAVFILATIYDDFKLQISSKFLRYFCEIIFISIIMQIISLPFILHGIGNLAIYGFIANILAIPLTSFFIMPLGFLSFFLMPLNLEKYVLLLMNEGILLLEKIINFVNDIPYSSVMMPHISSLGFVLSLIAIALILFHKSYLRYAGILLFLSSFLTLKFDKKPDLIFDKDQKFFAIYDEENGLTFSEKMRPSRQLKSWLKHFNQTEYKVGNFCQKNICDFTYKNRKILVIQKRSKIGEICKNDEYYLAVNLTKKFEMPSCVRAERIIDNIDFGKTLEIYLDEAVIAR